MIKIEFHERNNKTGLTKEEALNLISHLNGWTDEKDISSIKEKLSKDSGNGEKVRIPLEWLQNDHTEKYPILKKKYPVPNPGTVNL